jgi:hypothetical protein
MENDWWKVVGASIILMEALAFGLAFKRHLRSAGFALAASPLLLLYIAMLQHFEGLNGNGPWFAVVVAAVHFFPLATGLAYLFGARIHVAVFWLAWTLELVPLAYIILMTCCFRVDL